MNLRELFAGSPPSSGSIFAYEDTLAAVRAGAFPDAAPRAFDSQAITALCADDDSGPSLPAREGVLVVDSVVHAQARVVAALDCAGPQPTDRGRRA